MSNKANFGKVADDYAKYRDEIPSILFEQLKERDVVFSKKSVIDLGSGSGIFSRAMAKQGADVTGVEPEESLIVHANKVDQSLGINITYIHSTAEEVALPSNSYDMVAALRAWHWFDRNIVNQQVMKQLKENGYLIVIHSIFVPQLSQEVQETLHAIKEFIGELKSAGSMGDIKERRSGLPLTWFEEWKGIGFQVIDEWQYDYTLTFSLDDWCGKVKTLSWLCNENDEVKDKIITAVRRKLKHTSEPLSIPHNYSVVVLKK